LSSSRLGDVNEDAPWLSIRWEPDRRCVHAEWISFANSAEFRASNLKIVEAVRDRHAALLVIDNRRLEGVTSPDQLWIRDTFVPLLVAAGLRRLALVLARHGLAKIASEEILGQTGSAGPFFTRTFATVPEAMEWVVGDDRPAKVKPR